MFSRSFSLTVKVCALFVLIAAGAPLSGPAPAEATGGNTITVPDSEGHTGEYTSLALDTAGHPLISYHLAASGFDLKVLHCGDATCTAGNTIATPDTAIVGRFTSLAVDASGNPVVSYEDQVGGTGALKVLHCGNPTCTAGNTSAMPDASGFGQYTSLVLDSNGNPVVSYKSFSPPDFDLKVLHCGNSTCTAGNTISVVDSDAFWSSLALDAPGNPVVAYNSGGFVTVLHCNDPNCVGADESITTHAAGQYVSMALDATGNPVVSYEDTFLGTLQVMHCNDPDCGGGDDSAVEPDASGVIAVDTSVSLDASGNPVVSYYDFTNEDLRVVHCGNANCTATNSVASPDTTGDVGRHTSLALDTSGNPVISYWDATNANLKVLHCGNPACDDLPKPVGGISLEADPGALPLETSQPSSPPWGIGVGIAAAAGLLGLSGASWWVRRRRHT